VLRLIPRRKALAPLPVLADPAVATPVRTAAVAPTACALTACIAGSRATVLEVRCGDVEACRLRALGLCEGTAVDVVRSRGCTLLEVRGARLARGAAIASGITVLPLA